MANYQDILNYIKAHKEEVSIPELQKVFSADYLSIYKIIRQLIEDGALHMESGVRYSFNDTAKEINEDNVSDRKDAEDEEDRKSKKANLNALREEFIKMMAAFEKNGEDDNEDEDVDDSDEDADKDDLDEKISPEELIILQGFHEGILPCHCDGNTYVVPKGLSINDIPICFKIIIEDGKAFLSDNKFLFSSLQDRGFAVSGLDEYMGNLMDRYHINAEEDELRIQIKSPEEATSCMLQLFAVIECILIRSELNTENQVAQENLSNSSESKDASEHKEETDDLMLVDFCGNEPENNPYDMETLPQEIAVKSEIITKTLADFHIDSIVVNVSAGASVIRFDLDIPRNISHSSVMKHDQDLAIQLYQKNKVRVYRNMANGMISVEVPKGINLREKVLAEELINDGKEQFEQSKAPMFVIGEDIEGNPVYGNLSRMRNILIGGLCGSGKSTFIHTMIYSLITRYSPDDVRLILCDSKQSEYTQYSGMPHLLTSQIVSNSKQTVQILQWAIKEMERRYQLFLNPTLARDKIYNIDDYNASRRQNEKKLFHVVIFVDEYPDLMTEKKYMEELIIRLTSKSRAAGIYLVITTHEFSDEIITNVIKSCFPTRVAFNVASPEMSFRILDEFGAEKLLEFGDMLIRSESDFYCRRVQGAYVPQEALIAAVAKAKEKYKTTFDE